MIFFEIILSLGPTAESGLVDYQYSLNPAPLIGLNYYGSELFSNSGFLGSGFVHGEFLVFNLYIRDWTDSRFFRFL